MKSILLYLGLVDEKNPEWLSPHMVLDAGRRMPPQSEVKEQLSEQNLAWL